MTVPIEQLGYAYQCNGSTVDFLVPFRLLDPADLEVTLTTEAGSEVALVNGDDFTVVTVAGDRYCRTVEVYQTGAKLVLDRATPAVQTVDFTENDPFPPETVEAVLDRSAMILQEQRRRLLRGVAVPAAWTYPPLVLPQYQAGRGLVWDPARPGYLTNGDPAALPEVDIASRIVFAPEIGLALDGVTDDAPKLQAWANDAAAHGGGMLVVVGRAGAACRLNGRYRGGTGVALSFVGCEVRVGAEGGFALRGEVARTATALDLAAPVTQGATTLAIDATSLGGQALSALVPVGSSINLTSAFDSAGTDVDRSRYSVTAVNDGLNTLTLHRGTDWAYASGVVRVEISSLLTATTTEYARTVQVEDGTKFLAGSWVMVEDDRPCPSSTGLQNSRIRQEMARVLEQSGNTLSLSRFLEHDFSTSYRGRVTLIDPVIGAEVQGATIVLAEAEDAYNQIIADVRYAVNCRIVDSAIDHDALYSRPGSNFRLSMSYGCTIERCEVLNPRYYSEGQGYCFRAQGATEGTFLDCNAEGGRIGFTCGNGATNIKVIRPRAWNQSNKALDCHGQDERTIHFEDVDVGGYNVLSDGTRYAISAGNPTWQAGAKRVSVSGGKIAYQDSGDIVLYVCPPASDVTVFGVRMDKPWRVVSHVDVAGAGTLVARRVVLDSCLIFDRQDWLVWARGKNSGASVATLDGLHLRNIHDEGGVSKLFNIKDATYVFLGRIDYLPATLDGVYNYSMYAEAVDELVIKSLVGVNANRGLSITDVTNLSAEVEWRHPASGTTVLATAGTNTGVIQWTGLGYTPSFGTTSGALGGITFIRSYPTPP